MFSKSTLVYIRASKIGIKRGDSFCNWWRLYTGLKFKAFFFLNLEKFTFLTSPTEQLH